MATQETSLAGREISRYLLLERIGQGGMGVVYRARDTQLDRFVALKIIPRAVHPDDERKRRFLHEARAASALNHPNIVHIYEIGEEDGTDFIAMEFVAGQRLDERITGKGLPVGEVLSYSMQIADALAKAHAAGVVHRDLKPSNVMITPDGLVKILDFGLAKHIPGADSDELADTLTIQRADPETGDGLIVGTAAYMSPEQAEGRQLDGRSDIFSFGALVYEMLTSRRAFRGESAMATVAAILRDEPVPLRDLRPEVPEELDRIVSRCLRKDVARRVQHMSDVRVALQDLKEESDTSRFRFAPVATRKRSLRPWLWLAAALVLLVVAWLLRPDLPDPRPIRTTQLTHTRHGKLINVSLQPRFVVGAPVLTDGSRVYFAEEDPVRMSATRQVSITGGEVIDVPMPPSMQAGFDLVAMAPGGSELLFFGPPHPNNWTGGLWSAPLPAGAASRVGDLLATDVTYSPDGSRLALTVNDELVIAKRDGSGAHRIAKITGLALMPRWHPTRDLIRFTAFNPDLTEATLWEVQPDGRHLRRLLQGWNSPPQDCCGEWTPDGAYYVFESRQNGVSNLFAIRETGTLLRRANDEPVQLTSGPLNSYRPVPSRDGTRIFFVGEERRGELERYDTRAGAFVPYLPEISGDSVAFSPDGHSISWVSFPEGTLWRGDIAGGRRVQLSFAPATAALPQWSPDGSEIAFLKREPGQSARIAIVPSAGGPVRDLPAESKDQGEPSWSPDGQQIVFGRLPWYRKPGPADKETAIYIWDRKTDAITKVPGSEDLFSARWSPDGRFIAALRFGNQEVVVYDTSLQRWRSVFAKGGGWPWWSKDGSYLYFGHDEKLERIRISDGAMEPVIKLSGTPRMFGTTGYWIGYTPDMEPLVFHDTGLQEIFALEWQRP
jgi:eukaryotic-like serine/threonine-protein kinase